MCRVVKTERLMLEISMWFGSVNEETYVHECDRARSLSIRKGPVTGMIQQAWNNRRSAGAVDSS